MPRTSTTIAGGFALALSVVAALAARSPVNGGSIQHLAAGRDVLKLFNPTREAGVLIFVSTDCPVSNAVAPEIQQICSDYYARGVDCGLVYEDVELDEDHLRTHLADYGYRGMAAAIDRDRAIADRVDATVTPQAVVIDRHGAFRYRGRINNLYEALGKTRQMITAHDLRDTLDALLAGRPVPNPETDAVGCFIVRRGR